MDLCGLRLYKPWLIPLSICLIYPFSVISNATHFMCAVIWVCWLSFLDSSSFSYWIHDIGLLCWSMHSVSSTPRLWCWILMDSFIWLFDVAACILWYPDFTPCCDMTPLWSNADSVVVGVCLRVDCLVMHCMWQPSKCMLWAWSTHGVHGRCERGWLDCWEWKMAVWLQSVVFACRASWPCVDVLLRSLKSRDWQ